MSVSAARQQSQHEEELHKQQILEKKLEIAKKLFAFYSQFSPYYIDASKSLYSDSAVTSLDFFNEIYSPDSLIIDFKATRDSDYEPFHESVLEMKKQDVNVEIDRLPMPEELFCKNPKSEGSGY